MRAGALVSLLKGVAARGGCPQRALDSAGLCAEEFADPEHPLDLAKVLVLFDRAAREVGDEALALHLGAAADLGELGAVSYVVLNAPTVGTALRNLARYAALYVEGARIRLEVRGREACSPTIWQTPATARHAWTSRGPRGRDDAADAAPYRARLASPPHLFGHQRPADVSEHERLLRAPLLFDQPEDVALVFDASDLELPVPSADRRVLPIVLRHLDESLPVQPLGDVWVEGVRDEISRGICDGQLTIHLVAKRLGLGVRTLQRRLAARGLVFKTMVESIRHDLALHYLRDEEHAISQITFVLGYSEVSAFNRAFRRWTGQTPLEHRRRARAPMAPS